MGYIFASVILLWGLGIITVIFIITMYLINTKRNLWLEKKAEKLGLEKNGVLDDWWYCVECYDNDRIWYPAHGSAEDRYQNDYINMYYEMKLSDKEDKNSKK